MSKTLVLGASLKPERYSNLVIHRLIDRGHEVAAHGLREGVVAEVKIDTEPILYKNIHTVTLYLNPTRQTPFFEYVLELNPQRVIFNPGTENPVFYELLRKQGIAFEIACTLVLLSTGQY